MGKSYFLVCGFLKQKDHSMKKLQPGPETVVKRVGSDFPGFPMSHVHSSGIRVSFGEVSY